MIEEQPAAPRFPVGSYCMHHMHKGSHGTLVMVASEKYNETRGRIVEISYVSDDGGGSGASFYWEEDELRPITDPKLFIAARVHEATKRMEKAKRELAAAEQDHQVWTASLSAIRVAQAAGVVP